MKKEMKMYIYIYIYIYIYMDTHTHTHQYISNYKKKIYNNSQLSCPIFVIVDILWYCFVFFVLSTKKISSLEALMVLNYIYISKKSKVGDHSRERLEGSLFNSYYTEV